MQEKNGNNSNSLDICQRLFDFFSNSLIARGIKRLTLGQPLPRRDDHLLRPAKSYGELMVHHMDHENSEQESGSEIQVLFKQSEEVESWTPVDPVVSKGKNSPGRKKELPLVQEKIEPQVQVKSAQVVLEPQSRSGPENTANGQKEDRSKMKGMNIPSENLTFAIDDKPKRTPRRFSMAPNINEKSDEFIRSRKEAMSRNMSMEPKKKS